jgi:hypothetical protein
MAAWLAQAAVFVVNETGSLEKRGFLIHHQPQHITNPFEPVGPIPCPVVPQNGIGSFVLDFHWSTIKVRNGPLRPSSRS